ncbi:MAG: class II fructose-bisphosphatase [Actinoallomurus sp.]
MDETPAECADHDAPRPEPDGLALGLIRVTEAAAIAAGRWVGRGSKHGADRAAVDAMRAMTAALPVRGVVVIGEGEKDKAPMLHTGEPVGAGEGPACDLAVDPVDGTTLTAKGMGNALSVFALSPRGSMFDPSAVFYMDKLVCGPAAASAVDLRAPAAANVRAVAGACGLAPEDVTVCVLDRPRHRALAGEVRAAGARVKYISDGDVACAVLAAQEGSGVHLLLGVGGTPEGIITAGAVKCLGGVMQARLRPRDDDERIRALDAGHDLDRVLGADDLIAGDDVWFAATGITDGEFLRGVRYSHGRVATESVVMSARDGVVRYVHSRRTLGDAAARPGVDPRPGDRPRHDPDARPGAASA